MESLRSRSSGEVKGPNQGAPIVMTGIIMSESTSQNSFPVLQAKSTDRHITSSFEIPAASFGMFMLIALMQWVAVYDRLILPLASRIMGRPAHLSAKHRMGIGLFFSFLSLVVRAIVQSIRRATAIAEGYSDNPQAVLGMSAFWLVPQSCLSGMAEAFNMVGHNEFYMSEFPRGMSSIACTLAGVGMSVANLLASFIMSIIDDVTKIGGKESWVSSNINKGHYDYYCWVLACLSFVNIVYFLVCSRAYGPCTENGIRVLVEGDEVGDE